MSEKDYNWLNSNSFKEEDEYYTPRILVEPITKYIKPNSTIWCPFDTNKSEFVKVFKELGHKVINTHIWDGQDFFKINIPQCDYIISNPPFTKKLAVLKRLYELKKPFAMILPLTMLNYQEVGEFFLDKELQLLIVDKKVSYDGNTASFNSSYYCYNILPKDIVFYHLENNNSGKYCSKSEMYEETKESNKISLFDFEGEDNGKTWEL